VAAAAKPEDKALSPPSLRSATFADAAGGDVRRHYLHVAQSLGSRVYAI
jgi:hypothetical protein